MEHENSALRSFPDISISEQMRTKINLGSHIFLWEVSNALKKLNSAQKIRYNRSRLAFTVINSH